MLTKAGVFHEAMGSYAYYIDEKSIRLTIKINKGEANKVICEYYDKYENVHSQCEMIKEASDEIYDYFTAVVSPKFRRLNYFFKIYSGKKEYIFKQYGFTDNIYDGDFQLPYLNPCDVYRTPSWLEKAVFYQIFPDAFCSEGQKHKLPQGYFGGTLKGITKHLDYIKKLGVNAIYLNPIFCSTTVHRYDVVDYYDVDPILGTKSDFKKLVDECHKSGIKVILDAVFNHSSHKNPMFLDVLENGKKSKFADFYAITSYKNGKVESYDRFAFEDYMPKLNTSNPKVQEYLIDVLLYWIKEFDIDGWRFDVANEIGHSFIKKLRSAVTAVKPEAHLLGEIWHEPKSFLLGDEYDGVTNFVLKDLIFKLHKREITAQDFINKYNTYYYSLPQKAIEASSNFLCNHDTIRVATEFPDEKVLMSMIALQFVMHGTPLIYFGEEVGMKQDETLHGDKGARTPIDFERAKNNSLFNFYKKVIKLKTKTEYLKGKVKLEQRNGLLVVTRTNKNKQLTLIINNTNKKKKFVIEEQQKDYVSGETLVAGMKLNLTQNDFKILIK